MSKDPRRAAYDGVTPDSGTATAIRRHATTIIQYPHPDGGDPHSDSDGWFTAESLPSEARSILTALNNRGLLEKEKHRGEDRPHEWRVKDYVYERAKNNVQNIATLHCGHTGVRNVRNGGFVCSSCGEPITRDEAKEVIQ